MSTTNPVLCIVQPQIGVISETFIRAHAERLSGVVGVVTRSNGVPSLNGKPCLSQSRFARVSRKVARYFLDKPWNHEVDLGYIKAIRKLKADVVLAEYGPTGELLVDACRFAKVPLVVHFHGYDASIRSVIAEHGNYQRVFDYASGIVAVSRAMENRLLELGAARSKLYYNPYGVDSECFPARNSIVSEPRFLAVGRFVEKKAPHITLLAFCRVLAKVPHAKLVMIGDGPLMPVCRDLVRGLGLEGSVSLLGAQSHDAVSSQMALARVFVQHSVEAVNGDCEGTPVAILEAGASGLPVVATRHAGIPDVVIEGKTGLLVDERDVDGMASQMIRLAQDPDLAYQIGQEAAKHIRGGYSMQQSINRLRDILSECAARSLR